MRSEPARASEAPAGAALMPESIASLAAVIGWPAALRLVETAPGRTLEISRLKTPTMVALEDWLGKPAAARLVRTYAGLSLYVPACARLARAERNRRIREAVRVLERTISTRAAVTRMAIEWRLTERHVWRCLAPVAAATEAAPELVLQQIPLL